MIATLLGLTATALLFFLIVNFFCMIQTASVSRLDDKIEELESREKQFEKLSQSHRQWMAVEESYNRVKTRHFLFYENFSDFRERFTRLIGESFQNVLRENYRIENIRNEFARIEVNLVFEGNYRKIKEFLHVLRNMKKVILVKSLVLKKKESLCYGEIGMEVYFVR